MKWNVKEQQTRLFLIGVVILLGGWSSAAVLFWTAGDGSDLTAGYEMSGGNVFPSAPEDSKTYIHDLEVLGGRSAVLADAFRHWFVGLWHGKSLALTVAGGTGVISFGIFFVSRRLRSDLKSDARDESGPDEPGAHK